MRDKVFKTIKRGKIYTSLYLPSIVDSREKLSVSILKNHLLYRNQQNQMLSDKNLGIFIAVFILFDILLVESKECT